MLDPLGEDSCWGTETFFTDAIGNSVLPELRNLKKPFGFLKKFLEENTEFQVLARLCTDKIRDRLHIPFRPIPFITQLVAFKI